MKVLITSVSAGGGHVKAAEALAAAYAEVAPSVQAVHLDVMDAVTPWFRKLYAGGYEFAINRAPIVWKSLYQGTDNAFAQWCQPAVDILQRRQAGQFFANLDARPPDLILTTHFLIPQLLSGKYHRHANVPVHCVVTDYDVHRFWLSERVNRYYVAREEMVSKLEELGVPARMIQVTGIPAHPKFLKNVDKIGTLRKLGLKEGRPTFAIVAGGLGNTSMETTVKSLLNTSETVQLITVSGRNRRLHENLNRLRPPSNVTLVNLSFVDNMHEIMEISDIVVTKPGGMTVTEALSKGKGMILYSPVPGQEERNAAYVVSNGAGVRVNSHRDIAGVIGRLLAAPEERLRMEQNARRIAKPGAAFDIVKSTLAALAPFAAG